MLKKANSLVSILVQLSSALYLGSTTLTNLPQKPRVQPPTQQSPVAQNKVVAQRTTQKTSIVSEMKKTPNKTNNTQAGKTSPASKTNNKHSRFLLEIS